MTRKTFLQENFLYICKMEKSKQILIDLLNGKSVNRWDCSIHKREIRAELRSLENKFETEIDLARESY